ncbi:MAG: aldehyde dehydrogenase family protein, partial [Acidobacteria bacterium]|nr:aldehyde dehydrogenase family protein [Acidobacteriota bacterium]
MYIDVRNPATGELAGKVAVSSPDDIRAAAAEAREAQKPWNLLAFRARARIIRRFHDVVLERHKEILDTIQSETGKTRRDALAEVVTVAGTARYYLAHGERRLTAKRRRGAVPLLTSAKVIHKPHGVVGLIAPWNYPFIMGVADALPALLAGNAVITKPSDLTPLSALLARDLLLSSGLNPNLFVIVNGRGDAGAELIRHVDYIGFTGGTSTGRKVAIAASERLIPYSLELGGKNPMVVLEGAPLDDAVMGLLAGAFSNSGQTCISVERVYVQESIYEDFARQVVEGTRRLKIGWSRLWDVDVGSLISSMHAEKVIRHVETAVGNGAHVLTGGKRRTDLGNAFVEPTVLAGVPPAAPLFREETFGPVISLYPVRTAGEAIRLANDSEFGLNASVWAKNRNQAFQIARQLETGSAAVNGTLLIYNTFDVPMGGVKQSGIGRRHGEHGILKYTQAQS